MGYRVLLAHPERCAQLAEKPGLVREIAASGAWVQVNWESLAGMNGRQAQGVALAFAGEGHIHCLATDTHDRFGRSPDMVRQGRDAVEALIGEGNMRRLMIDNPRRVLMGDKLEGLDGTDGAPWTPVKRRKWLWFS